MSSFDHSAPAELFLSKPAKGSRTKYRRFATAAEALRYAVEDLRIPKAFGAWLEVGMSASAVATYNACTIEDKLTAHKFKIGESVDYIFAGRHGAVGVYELRLAICISFPHRHAGSSVQPGVARNRVRRSADRSKTCKLPYQGGSSTGLSATDA
jgi:hypothetical protein